MSEDTTLAFGVALGVLLTILLQLVVDMVKLSRPWPTAKGTTRRNRDVLRASRLELPNDREARR